MPTTKLPASKTLETSQPLASIANDWSPEILPRSDSNSLTGLLSPEQILASDNNVRHQLARQLIHLRRFRGDSQVKVAKAMGTSQPAVARIESGEENFTADRLERHINTLRGRLLISVIPAEFPFFRPLPWWETSPEYTDWNLRFVAHRQQNQYEQVLIGVERTTPQQPMIAISETSR